MAIDYAKVSKGDKLRIVGMGAPGFANLGDIVTVTGCNGVSRCEVVREDGESAYFALACGASRLELLPRESYDANGSPVSDDQLSRDLTEAARDSSLGG